MVNRSNRVNIVALSFGHGIVDLYANFLPALLPVFTASFALSRTRVGMLISIIGVSGSLCQVIYGYLGDRWGRRLFMVPGPAIAAIFMCLIGLSPNFTVLIILLIIGGMGVSAFHPHAASLAGDMAGSKRGLGLSLFMASGTAGYALGPMIAAALMSSIGPAKIPIVSIFGIITSGLLYKYAVSEKDTHRERKSSNTLAILKPQIKVLTLLVTIAMFRATVSVVFVNFMSLLMNQRGQSLVAGGVAISLLTLATATGTVLGGYLYDTINKKKLLIFSLLLSFPFLIALVYTHGAAMVVFLLLSGLLIGCSNPIPLAIAQELIPEVAGTASSLMMGLSWGLAAIIALLFGVVADLFGGNVAPAMSIAACLTVVTAVIGLALPYKRESSNE